MSGVAAYNPMMDIIKVPPREDFSNIPEYYSTLFHEMVHSTGHSDRLDRDEVANVNRFGSEPYSREELVAEIGAAMLCGFAGIDNSTIDNSVAYINSWLKRLKNDKRLVVYAAARAQRAVDYIMGVEDEKDCEAA